MAVSWEDLRRFLLPVDGVEEGTSYGTPAFRVRRKLLARLREDGETLVVTQVEDIEKEMLIQTQPDVYYITDHYRGYPAVLVRLSKADRAELCALLEQSWQRLAPVRRQRRAAGKPPA